MDTKTTSSVDFFSVQLLMNQQDVCQASSYQVAILLKTLYHNELISVVKLDDQISSWEFGEKEISSRSQLINLFMSVWLLKDKTYFLKTCWLDSVEAQDVKDLEPEKNGWKDRMMPTWKRSWYLFTCLCLLPEDDWASQTYYSLGQSRHVFLIRFFLIPKQPALISHAKAWCSSIEMLLCIPWSSSPDDPYNIVLKQRVIVLETPAQW